MIKIILGVFAAIITINNHFVISEQISNYCLGCLCEAVSGCNLALKCEGDICGPFHITWVYWADSGKPTQPGESPESPTAFANCVNDHVCAARTITGYMNKYAQDCNNDGRISCMDYAYIHKLGSFGCKGTLPDIYQKKMEACIQQANIS